LEGGWILVPMRLILIGGTGFLGPVIVRLAIANGHEVAVAHTGKHEGPRDLEIEHLHGSREDLLAAAGPVERWRPQVLVDTFAGGASASKAAGLVACSRRTSAHVVAISSGDVYHHCVEAGLGDGSGAVPLPAQAFPIDEDAPLRVAPYPGSGEGHDNAAMERDLRQAGADVAVIRPAMIYGRDDNLAREWRLVRLVREGQRRLELPDGGMQLFSRVAVERVARAILAAAQLDVRGFWACNATDPAQWTYAGLAALVGRVLDWEWDPVRVPFDAASHPFKVTAPVLLSDRRLREELAVTEPDPQSATEDTIRWLFQNGPRSGAY
jgi:nucleoside-diphosphate-sugar epimerase